MKLWTRIITVYLLLLCLGPALEPAGLLPEIFCCVVAAEAEHDDGSSSCNPFVSCHCCLGFTFTETAAFFCTPSLTAVEHGVEKTSVALHYIHLVWHPPKSVASV